MCAGAIINSRIDKVVYGAADERFGCAGSFVNLFEMEFNHKPEWQSGVMKKQCEKILQNFFKELREKIKQRKKKI